MNKVLCWLTGGHQYADMNLKSSYNPFTFQFLLVNRCVKCGKKITVTIDEEIINRDIEEFEKRRRLYVRKDGDDNASD